MSYLARLNAILTTFHAVDSSAFTGQEEEFAPWDAMIAITLELWDRDPALSAAMAGMTVAERYAFAGENCDDETSQIIAARLDSECCVCGSPMGEHEAAQQFSCDAVYASGNW